ncbi:MAG: lipocalin family protein [Bacteroides sp.]|nr:lipocalin family protein [Bacteroides sp.]
MRRFTTVFISLAALLPFCSCKKEGKTPAIVGEWNITALETRSATIGSQSIDVYISFSQDGTFALYQRTGEGRYESFTGRWALSSDVLSGTYSDGSAWACSYDFSISGDTMTLASRTATSEISTYRRTKIPENVISEAI